MAKKTLLIDRAAFIDWYFDHDMCKSFFDDQGIAQELKETGKFSVSAQALLDSAGYLPESVAAQDQPNQDQVVLDALEEIDMSAYDKIKFA